MYLISPKCTCGQGDGRDRERESVNGMTADSVDRAFHRGHPSCRECKPENSRGGKQKTGVSLRPHLIQYDVDPSKIRRYLNSATDTGGMLGTESRALHVSPGTQCQALMSIAGSEHGLVALTVTSSVF